MVRFDLDGAVPFTLVFEDVPQAAPHLELLRAERPEFEAVLGSAVRIAATEPRTRRWIVREPRRPDSPPTLEWSPTNRTLTSYAATSDDFVRTLNLLHTLARSRQDCIAAGPAATPAVAAGRIYDEIAGSYPSFALRGLDWDEITARHAAVDMAEDFTLAAAAWVAELDDAHTAIRRTASIFNPGYRGVLTADGVQVLSLPDGSPACRAGVEPGWVIEVDDPAEVLRTTGASARHRTQIAARRALAVTGNERRFRARRSDGRTVEWTETARTATLDSTLGVSRDDDGALRIRLAAFDGSLDLAEAFDDLLVTGRAHDRMVLDLRGNSGGSLVSAIGLRDRFLHRATVLGSIRFSTGTGTLAPARTLRGDPSTRPRWPGPLTVLVDEMTYSAAEDFVLGLQGLEHVTVLGCATGGGSGRARTVPLTDGLVLTVSTALTLDRTGRCIEGAGVPVDGPLPG